MAKPVNVRIAHPDGSETPVELIPRGIQDDGMDLWSIPAETHLDLLGGDSVKMDELPPRTSVQFDGVA